MATFEELARASSVLSDADLAWLDALVADWQIICDLSFSDLVLWLPDPQERGRRAVAQVRPTTGATTLPDDVVGSWRPAEEPWRFEQAMATGETIEWTEDDRRVQFVPVVRDHAIAVMERRSVGLRPASRLETSYQQAARDFLEMVRVGDFPAPEVRSTRSDSARVGDGFIRLDSRGQVLFSSPNATSAYRRLGLATDLEGANLAAVTRSLVGRRPTDGEAATLLSRQEQGEADIHNDSATVLVRRIAMRSNGRPAGAVVLLRDVTELRLRDRQLISKEATIREVHHRVKNNLQTVAALLRLQARRVSAIEARTALDEAVRRVGSIALVHEVLSRSFDETVDFDQIADQLLRTVLEVMAPSVRTERIGSFGSIDGEIATPLAMVLTELVQNAGEHAFADGRGRITVAVNRIRNRLRMRVSDDGVGLPDPFEPSGLGLSIVRTLIESDLGGQLAFERPPRGGTTVAIEISLT